MENKTLSFIEAKKVIAKYISENKGQIKRSFPRMIWNRIREDITSKHNIPLSPDSFYGEWNGWNDWLGKITPISKKLPTLEELDTLTVNYIEEHDRFDIAWNVMLKHLKNYYDKYGTLIVSKYVNKELQSWTGSQRSLQKKGMLKPERKKSLDSIKFDWRPQQNDWDTNFNILAEFKEEFGHVDVPCRYRDNFRLGQWVREQRMYYRDKVLRNDRIENLEKLGFTWVIPEAIKHVPFKERGTKEYNSTKG